MYKLSKRFLRTSLFKLRIFPKRNFLAMQRFNFSSHPDFEPEVKKIDENTDLNSEIDGWVKNNKVVLFMKGVPQMPQCGFSNYVVQVLNFYGIKDFRAIDILEDDVLRETVKQYSNWPTYPQLYVNGILIGMFLYFL